MVGYGSGIAWRWTKESGRQDLPSLTPESSMYVFGVSSDGRWTVGRDGAATQAAANEGFDSGAMGWSLAAGAAVLR